MNGLNIVVGVTASFVTTIALDDGEILSSEALRHVVAEHLLNRLQVGSMADVIDNIQIIEVANGDDLTILASQEREL